MTRGKTSATEDVPTRDESRRAGKGGRSTLPSEDSLETLRAAPDAAQLSALADGAASHEDADSNSDAPPPIAEDVDAQPTRRVVILGPGEDSSPSSHTADDSSPSSRTLDEKAPSSRTWDDLPPSSRLISGDSTFGKLSHAGGTAMSITTLRDTLHLQDTARTRWFVGLSACVALAIAMPLPLIGGDPFAKAVYAAGMICTSAVCMWLYYQLRNPANYTLGRVLVVGYVCVGGCFSGIYFYGAYSPGAVTIPFGLYFFGLAASYRGTFSVWLVCTIAYAALALLPVFGVIQDRGLITANDLTTLEALAVIVTTEGLIFATYIIARLSRRATERALEEHDKAVRVIAGRDALLNEARMDLEGVLRARGLGRFTDEVVGNYRLGEILGRGGMGEVYSATHIDSEERAAVKVLHAHTLQDPAGVKRFLRECELASKLKVANVVKVLETSESGAPIPYIAMERLHGQDLSEYLRAHGRMRSREVVKLVRDVGRGLEAARKADIVHRDIKPRNLFYSEQGGSMGLWKILDFGVSKLTGEVTMSDHSVVGTPSYMAPEQASSGDVSHKTDLFSLGVITYRALTGRPPFSGDSAAVILYKVVREMPMRPSDVSARIGSDVDKMLMIALAKDQADRFSTAAEFVDALDKALRGRLPAEFRERASGIEMKHPWA